MRCVDCENYKGNFVCESIEIPIDVKVPDPETEFELCDYFIKKEEK